MTIQRQATGLLCTRNEVTDVPCIITASIAADPKAPLDLLRATPVSDRVVIPAIGTPDQPVTIDIVWDWPVTIDAASLINTNLRHDAAARFEAWLDANRNDKVADTIGPDGLYPRIVPPLYDPATIPLGEPGQWAGTIDPRDQRLFSTDAHAVPKSCQARAIRWTVYGGARRPDDSADTVYRIGLAWAGYGIRIDRDLPSGEGDRPGDEVITMGGGATWIEAGINKKTAVIDLSLNTVGMRNDLLTAMRRIGYRVPVLWLPNTASPHENYLLGGLFRREEEYAHKYIGGAAYTSSSIKLIGWTE
jgi:hypothetical protein